LGAALFVPSASAVVKVAAKLNTQAEVNTFIRRKIFHEPTLKSRPELQFCYELRGHRLHTAPKQAAIKALTAPSLKHLPQRS
jgi:ribosome-binding factor A